MCIYVQQNSTKSEFNNSDSWVILSPIEQSIKSKIEKVGTPLKDWDIQINYGIKTGFNDAFIIDTKKRNEILSNCKTEEERNRTDEIIRPILRGRDIKRYGYEWADLWLINTHNGIKEKNIPPIDIKDYPAIKEHLDKYWDKISTRDDKGVTPYNLRNCAYMDDFFKQKLVWLELTDHPKWCYENNDSMVLAGAFLLTTQTENLFYLLGFMNSKLNDWLFDGMCNSSGTGTNQWKKFVIDRIPVPIFDKKNRLCIDLECLVKKAITQNEKSDLEKKIDRKVYELYGLSQEEISFIEETI